MNINRWLSLSLMCSLTISYTSGCLRRKESITITRDGTIRMALVFEGDRGDFELGDAMPDSYSNWEVTRTVEHKDDGKETHTLRATQAFAPGEALPTSFASPDDPDADLYLTFPTTYRTETRDDGVYHFFRRIYPPRSWAVIHLWEETLIGDQHEELAKKPIEDLTAGERRTLFQAFVAIEAYKQLEYLKEALREAAPTLPIEARLRARQTLIEVYDSVDLEAIAEQCINTPDDESRAACFDEETAILIDEAYETYTGVLARVAGFDPAQRASLDRAYQRSKRRYELTGTLANEYFDISVTMPGRIVAHNADRVDDDGQVACGEWEFDGRAFRDRSYELILITREPLEDVTEDSDASDDR